jgi:hypothetical protein
VLLLGNYTIQISVPWVTPVVPHLIVGTGTTADGGTFGTIIQACNHTSGCSGSTFPNGTNQLNFAFPHGPFPSGTYSAMIIGGAYDPAKNTSGPEWTEAAFGEELRDISLDCNDVANFAYLTAQEQERSGFNHVQAQSCTSAGGFWDKLQSQQQGTSHFSIRNYSYRSNTVPTCTTPGLGPPTGTPCYAAVIDLSGMNMTFGPGAGSCSIYPTAYPVFNSTTGKIGGANITYAGSGCVGGISCTINSRQNAITTTATCTATIGSGQLTSVSISGGGVGYDSGMMGYSGPDAVEEVTAVGTNAPAYITGGIWISGASDPQIGYVHCEWSNGYCVTAGGGMSLMDGGLIHNIDVGNWLQGLGVIHLGNNGSPNLNSSNSGFVPESMQTALASINARLGQVASGGTAPLVVDDQHGLTLGANWPSLAYYSPGGFLSTDGQGLTFYGHANNASSNTDNSGTCTLAPLVGQCIVTFAVAWSNSPVCVATDQSSTGALWVMPTTTSLTIKGPPNDTVAYHCEGNPK